MEDNQAHQPDPAPLPEAPALPEVDSPPPEEVLKQAPSTDEIVKRAESAEEIVGQQQSVDELLHRRREQD